MKTCRTINIRSDMLTFLFLNSFYDKIKGFFRSLDEKLLDQVFKKLINLTFLHVLLDLIHPF